MNSFFEAAAQTSEIRTDLSLSFDFPECVDPRASEMSMSLQSEKDTCGAKRRGTPKRISLATCRWIDQLIRSPITRWFVARNSSACQGQKYGFYST